MAKVAFRPYSGDDREEKIESDRIEQALALALAGDVTIGDTIPADATHVFGRLPKHWARPVTLVYPEASHLHLDYWNWEGFLAHARRSSEVHDLAGATKRVAEIHAAGHDAFVKATMPKFYTSIVPRGMTLSRHLDALAFSFIDRGPCLIVQESVAMKHEYRILVVDGQPVTGAGTVFSHTPDDNQSPFNPLVSPNPADDNCTSDEALVSRYLDFARQVIPLMPTQSFSLDVAMINGEIGIVELNPLMLGQIGLFACDPTLLTSAVLRSCGLIDA
jgi:hypothetical protein